MFCLKNGLNLVLVLLFVGLVHVMGIPREEGDQLKRVALEWGLAILVCTLVL